MHGRVTLASGKEAEYYVDLRRITLDAEAAPLIGPALLELTADRVRPCQRAHPRGGSGGHVDGVRGRGAGAEG